MNHPINRHDIDKGNRFCYIIIWSLLLSAIWLGCGGDDDKDDDKIDIPPAPTDLTAVATPDSVELRWTVVELADEYNIYRRLQENSEFSSIATAIKAPPYADPHVIEEKTYVYKVAGVNDDERFKKVEGAHSAPLSVTIPTRGKLEIMPASLDFGQSLTDRDVALKNTGGRAIQWSLETKDDWIAFDPNNGTLNPGASQTVRITVSREGKAPGEYDGLIISKVDTNQEGPTIPVQMERIVDLPKLCIDPADQHLIFEIGESRREITISNCGGGIMMWKIDPPFAQIPWLNATLAEGKVERDNPDRLTFIVDRQQEPCNPALTATVTINAGDAGSEQIVIEVRMPEERWEVAPTSLDLDNKTSPSGAVQITNTGEAQLFWSASASEPWLVLDKWNGVIAPGESDTITVFAEFDGLALGERSGVIEIESRCGQSERIEITATKVGIIPVTVRSSRSGRPVSDVEIIIDGQPPIDCPSGDCDVMRLTPGRFDLEARKVGYLSAAFAGELDSVGNSQPAEMWLRPIPRATNTIRDLNFQALKDAYVSPDGSRVYISDEAGHVFVLDGFTNQVITQIPDVALRPEGIVAHPQGHEIYVVDADADMVVIVDPAAREVIARVTVDQFPRQLAISEDGARLYVTCQNSSSVVVVDTTHRQVEEEKSCLVGRNPERRNAQPYGIVLSPDERFVYTANAGENTVSVIDVAICHDMGPIAVGERPQHLAISEKYLYVSNTLGNRVSVIDLVSLRVIDVFIEQGILLDDLAVVEEPMGGEVVYVLDQTQSAVHLIDSVTWEVIADEEIRVGALPEAIIIRPDLAGMLVVNGGSADVSILTFPTR